MFSHVHSWGMNSGLVGWGHPYCRVIGRSMSSCKWFPYAPPPASTLRESLLGHLVLMAETAPGVARLDLRRRFGVKRAYTTSPAHHKYAYAAVHKETLRLVADARLALVVAYYPVPHNPYIWDRGQARFSLDGTATYADNLALADLALGEIRTTLEGGGLGPKTTLIVTSDHWQRERFEEAGPDLGNLRHRVPFIVHLPGQTEGVHIDCVFQTTLVQDLILRVLRGGFRDAQGVAAWVRERAANPKTERLDPGKRSLRATGLTFLPCRPIMSPS